ncbi:MAG: flagellar biosynthesis anti-sigma factor FlgM [Oscillospiraceae bacterium]|nr:flagellar biosynthesis anti-sigma factor FlgM [Oscillospiraceae bacterium]
MVGKVSGDLAKVYGVGQAKAAPKRAAGQAAPTARDRVSISVEGKDFATVLGALKGVPDVREEKVAEIRRLYREGAYKVNAAEVAERMLRSVVGV